MPLRESKREPKSADWDFDSRRVPKRRHPDPKKASKFESKKEDRFHEDSEKRGERRHLHVRMHELCEADEDDWQSFDD